MLDRKSFLESSGTFFAFYFSFREILLRGKGGIYAMEFESVTLEIGDKMDISIAVREHQAERVILSFYRLISSISVAPLERSIVIYPVLLKENCAKKLFLSICRIRQ